MLRRTLLSMLALMPAWFESASAQDLPTTTEFGVTITADQITDAIQESQDFWGPVRSYLASDAFPGEKAARESAGALLKRVNDELQRRLFDADEPTAQDLIQYLTHRLRKFELYRRLRVELANDAALAALVERWEHAQREIGTLPEAERPERQKGVLALLPDEMAALGVPAEKASQTLPLWQHLAGVQARMCGTEAGKCIMVYEQDAQQLDRAAGEVIGRVAAAADWVLIVRVAGHEIGRADFEHALRQLAELRDRRLTAAKKTPDRK